MGISKKILNKKYQYGFHDKDTAIFETHKGISREIVKEISRLKNEPKWMLDIRLKAFDQFIKMDNPNFGPDLSFIDYDKAIMYSKAIETPQTNWDDVPKKIKNTFKKLGIMEAEAKFLNGVSTQYDSQAVYNNISKELEEYGVIFTDTDTAVKQYPDLVKKYFGSIVPSNDNKFAALNTAFWSGGSFVYVPKGVEIKKPLQAYFRINGRNVGQFERTIIILEEGAKCHYVEGCTAPVYSEDNLHCAVVEVFLHKNAVGRYTTIQNWSDNVLNLVTKRSIVYENAKMSWIDGNIGARINMKYPSSILAGKYASSDCISIAVANKGIIQDAGAKMIHLAPYTKSRIVSKSVSFNGGDTCYRGLVKIEKDAHHSSSKVECDTLLMDNISRTDTLPTEIIKNKYSSLEHEAKVSNISEEQLFYMMSKGISKEVAENLIVLGFIEPFTKELPMEYAIELNRLITMDMEGSVG
ncbi:Fe-S cluster assembly protein SufB [Mycoplasma sp. E35C]|uniref:Fe-S cluster assembly protein SufB n=1 Tax=Mycoplasma sp. E35C TaxID=2801918 RepID=UPI001CA3BDD6|nr:Fe-S cluster assembly protein SufB [Mycoplasma sp. E35C]QZX49370.1 Fe-S cluster assembly protein SufB [Mycoplasma sp. E35C]